MNFDTELTKTNGLSLRIGSKLFTLNEDKMKLTGELEKLIETSINKEITPKVLDRIIKFDSEEQLLFSQTRKRYEQLRSSEYFADLITDAEHKAWLKECAEGAEHGFKLCQLLAKRGYKENFFEFFFLYTAEYPKFAIDTFQSELLDKLEELLFFVECNNYKADAVDKTLNVEFRLAIPGIYRVWLTRTDTGWIVKYGHYGIKVSASTVEYLGKKPIETDRNCMGLIECLRQDKIYFPKEIDCFFEHLWQKGAEGLSVLGFKQQLDSLVDCFSRLKKESEWIRATLPALPKKMESNFPVREVSVYA